MQYTPVSQVEKFNILKILQQKNTKISSHELNFDLNVANREKTIDADPDPWIRIRIIKSRIRIRLERYDSGSRTYTVNVQKYVPVCQGKILKLIWTFLY